MNTSHKMKLFIKDFLCKLGQIHRKLHIWSHLLKKPLMENFMFCARTVLSYIKDIIIVENLSDLLKFKRKLRKPKKIKKYSLLFSSKGTYMNILGQKGTSEKKYLLVVQLHFCFLKTLSLHYFFPRHKADQYNEYRIYCSFCTHCVNFPEKLIKNS